MPKDKHYKAIREMKDALERAHLLQDSLNDPYTRGLVDSLMSCLKMLGQVPMTYEEAHRKERSFTRLTILPKDGEIPHEQ